MKHLFTLIAFFAVSLCGFAEHQFDYSQNDVNGHTVYYKLNVSTKEATITNDGITYVEDDPNTHIYKYFGVMVIPTTIEVDKEGFVGTYTVTTIEDEAFLDRKSLLSIAIPNTVTSIGKNAFKGCSKLTTISIPSSVTNIGVGAFENCEQLNKVKFAEGTSLERIDANTFRNCTALENIDIPNTVTYIGAYCFAGCTNLSYFQPLQSALKEIEYSAFEGCSNLHSVIIPRGVKRIGLYAFKDCYNLEYVYCDALVPPHLKNNIEILDDVLYGRVFYHQANLIVPIPAVYENASDRWKRNTWNIKACASLELIDGEVYPYWSGDPLTYTGTYSSQYIRTFSESNVGKWNALYVPFAIDVNSEDYDIAEIFNLCPVKDTNGDGFIDSSDDNFLVVSVVKNGATLPNKPYLIRPKQAGEMNITIKDATIYPASEEEGKVTCSTTRYEYVATGTYKGVTVAPNSGYYVAANGKLTYSTSSSVSIKPNRWVMTTSGKGDYASAPIESKANIGIFVLGEDEGDATAIANILSGKSADRGTYTIDGRKVADDVNLKAGIYIKNGKKIVIK